MFVLQDRTRTPERRASHTAEFMAVFRALESCRPVGERLFLDPYAKDFVRPSLRVAVWLARNSLMGSLIRRFIDSRWPGARSSGVARTRLIDDAVVAALTAGYRQIVLLGAGFDARAYRLAGIDAARVFEVDQAGTMAAKREVLRSRGKDTAKHVTFVQVDFERDDLQQALISAGFRTDARAVFVWEGVTNYLTAEAVDATLRSIAGLSTAGSRLLFTYVHRGIIDGSTMFPQTDALVATLRSVGEPWTFGLDPSEAGAYLAARGFKLLMDHGARDYRSRYLGEPGQGYEFYRAAMAQRCDTDPVSDAGREGDAACPK